MLDQWINQVLPADVVGQQLSGSSLSGSEAFFPPVDPLHFGWRSYAGSQKGDAVLALVL